MTFRILPSYINDNRYQLQSKRKGFWGIVSYHPTKSEAQAERKNQGGEDETIVDPELVKAMPEVIEE